MRRFPWWLCLLLACDGSTAAAPDSPPPLPCDDLHDCPSGQVCLCRGVGIDPCMPGMSDGECAEARCGGRICADPEGLPPPP